MKNIVIFLLLIVTLGFGFYWFGLKPQNDRRECYSKAIEARERWPENDINLDRVFDVIYDDCIKSKGY